MIDYNKCDLITTPEYLLNNPNLDFVFRVNEKTGEVIKNKHGYVNRVAQFGNLKVFINENENQPQPRINLVGSIHQHYQGGTNFSDYTFTDICTTINEICDLLQLPPDKIAIHTFEFGLNLTIAHNVKDVLNSIIAYKKGKVFENNTFKGKGKGKICSMDHYNIKFYDKAMQGGLVGNLLRFEIHVGVMQFVQNKGLKLRTFADLLNKETYNYLLKILLRCFDSILMYDYRINLNAIEDYREQLVLTQGMNAMFWEGYEDTHSDKGYHKKVKRFKDLVKKYAPDNLHEYLKTEITNKWFELLNSTPILPHGKTDKVPQYYTSLIDNIAPNSKRYCITCGKDISHQKSNSLFCSEKLNGPEGKKCRNRLSNLKRDEKRKYSGPTLFDVDLYLRTDYLHLKQIINQRN